MSDMPVVCTNLGRVSVLLVFSIPHSQLHWLACNGRTELLVGILQRGEFVDVTVRERNNVFC